MKAFKFTLQTVLEAKQKAEDIAQSAVIAAEGVVRRIEADKEVLGERAVEAEDSLRKKQQSATTSPELRDLGEYLALCQRRLEAKQDELMAANNTLYKKRAILSLAMKERKGIEKLKEKQYAAWKSEEQRQEAAFLDELGTTRYKKDGGLH